MEMQQILIIDDDRFIRRVLADALQERYVIREANCGESGFAAAAETSPDLIILDIEMPGLSGIDICRKFKETEQTQHIPVILISAHSNKSEIVKGLQAGADDYLTKPVNSSEVLARVDAHLRHRNYYADLERRDLQMLLDLYDSVSVLRNPMKILQLIVEKLTEVIEVERCSIVSINSSGEIFVKASNHLLENQQEVRLELERYPEIRKALETRKAVVVNDIKHDPLMAPVHKYLAKLDLNAVIVVPVIKKESIIGTLLLGTATNLKDGISDRVYKLCHLVANISANALENATLFESMQSAKDFFEEMAIRDGLTRLHNHRHFYDRLEEEFSRAVRYREPLSLIFFDIDDFKQVNDTYGHQRGDEVLRQIGRMVREVVRESDLPARYGGEEFVVLLPATGTEGALETGRRLSASIREFIYPALENEQVTVSMGVATFSGDNLQSFQQLVQAANQSMYAAKAAGKNRISLYSNEADATTSTEAPAPGHVIVNMA